MTSESSSDQFSLDTLNTVICESLLQKVRSKGIEQWFAVQSGVIPLFFQALSRRQQFRTRDLCICSPTGSGKTLTFVLPIVQHLLFKLRTCLRVLVLVPGTDLAQQIHKEFAGICKGTVVKVGSAIGSRPLSQDLKSIFHRDHRGKLLNKIDILVATPGKLYELLNNVPEFSLTSLETLVMDEADRIINSPLEHDFVDVLQQSVFGSLHEIGCTCERNTLERRSTVEEVSSNNDEIVSRYCLTNKLNGCNLKNHYDRGSHNLLRVLFTATLTQDAEKLHKFKLFCPRFLNFTTHQKMESQTILNEVGSIAQKSQEYEQEVQKPKWALPNKLIQKKIVTKIEDKAPLVLYLAQEMHYTPMLCFANSKEDVHRLYLLLKMIPSLRVIELSGKVLPKRRQEIQELFAKGKVDVVICSDLVARGIDFEKVDYVLNFDVPQRPHLYLHRVGRTARAGRLGTAITLLCKSETDKFQMICRSVIGRSARIATEQVDKKRLQFFCDQYQQLLVSLKKKVQKETIIAQMKRKKFVKNV